jgi:hypothetical protein
VIVCAEVRLLGEVDAEFCGCGEDCGVVAGVLGAWPVWSGAPSPGT